MTIASWTTAWGSPPRVREPPIEPRLIPVAIRITPACAGTTILAAAGKGFGQDHPRVCGNHEPHRVALKDPPGSPPRVREPHSRLRRADRASRITPACAGTTASNISESCASEDHPRVCGNHEKAPHADAERLGSPPRVREPL